MLDLKKVFQSIANSKKASIFASHLRESATRKQKNGSVVQLVRIHACHAWGRGFESRPDRQRKGLDNANYQDLFSFYAQSHFLFWINSKNPLHLLSLFTITFSTKLEFAKMICHLSFYEPEPFVGLCFGYDRCLVTDTDHLSSIINFGTDFGKMPGVSA